MTSNGRESALTSRQQIMAAKKTTTDFRGFSAEISWGGVAIPFQNNDFCMVIVNLQI